MYLFSWGTKDSSRQEHKGTQYTQSRLNREQWAGLQERIHFDCVYYTLAKQIECPTDQNSGRYGAELAWKEDRESYMEI